MSSKIRTKIQLQDSMDKEFAWRKKELHDLKTIVYKQHGTRMESMCIRAAVALLYAHWEGFVKKTSIMYVEYVSRQKLKHQELSIPFLAMAAANRIEDSARSEKAEMRLNLTSFFINEMKSRSNLNWETSVNTESNLSWRVFKDILLKIGIPYEPFETKQKMIDEKLLGNRNQIAHGIDLEVDYEEYINTHETILEVMQEYFNRVSNSAELKQFKLNP